MTSADLSILIVEDDFSFSLELEMLVKNIGYTVLASVDNSAKALEYIFADQPDLILMDVDINGKLTGIELAEKIQNLDIPILFITSFKQSDIYHRAKQTNFIGYMVKPVEEYSLRSSIELAINNLSLKNNIPPTEVTAFPFKKDLFFKKKGVFKKIRIDQIHFIEAHGNYSITNTMDDKLTTSLSLSELEIILKDHYFMRVHRSYVINLQKITTLDIVNNKVWIGQQIVPISRANKMKLIEAVRLLQ